MLTFLPMNIFEKILPFFEFDDVVAVDVVGTFAMAVMAVALLVVLLSRGRRTASCSEPSLRRL